MNYYVSRIKIVPHEPKACVDCGRNNLEKNIVIGSTGVDTFLCVDCETLMPITNRSAKNLLLNPSVGKKVTMRHNAGNS